MRHVYLAGEIGFDFTSADVCDALDGAAEDNEDVTLHLNSPGGDVGDAVMIDAMLRAFAHENPDLTATVEVDGYAASAASFAFLSAGKIIAHPSSMFMIHDPSSWAWGKAEELRKTAEALDKCRDAIVASYVRRTGRYEDEIRRAMAEETWFTAEEAVKWGLADELLKDGIAGSTAANAGSQTVFDAVHTNTTNRRDSEQMIVDDAQDESAKPEVEATEGRAEEAPAYRVIAGRVYQIATKESESNA